MNGVLKTEYNEDFDQKRKNSMEVSYYKYGKASLNYPNNCDAIASLKKRLELYEKTGNKDYLVDIANFAMLEYTYPKHKNAHYKPGCSEEDSPGVEGMSIKEIERFRYETT